MTAFFSTAKNKSVNKVIEIPVEQIIPNPNQPRQVFDDKELAYLAISIKSDGIIQPITVRELGAKYEIVFGERRYRAACLVGLATVPAIVITSSERKSALLAMIENMQRQNLSFFEEAFAISNLIDLYGMTQDDAAIRLGMAQSTLANKLRLLKLSEEERQLITDGNLTERHARALLRLETTEERKEVIEKVVKNGLNVDKTELLISQIIQKDKDMESFKKRSVLLRDVRLFVNTINKAVETIQMAGIDANAKKTQNDEYIEYVIRIPVNT